MNALVKTDTREAVRVLQNSLYPGAKPESVELVLSYCRMNSLDPMLKPVHIVPTNVKVGKDKWEWRDVLMPGIADYRIKAARSGEYAGKSEPEFGPVITEEMDGVRVTYPQWCKVIVRRFVKGVICDFPAKEYWLENYAVAGKDTEAPNKMWKKRAFGQIAKCAEAQALRMAFPEFSGGAPTAEEMEGKHFDGLTIDAAVETRPQRHDVKRAMDIIDHGQPHTTAESIEDSIPVLDEDAMRPRVDRAIQAFAGLTTLAACDKTERAALPLLGELDRARFVDLHKMLVEAMAFARSRLTEAQPDPFNLPPVE